MRIVVPDPGGTSPLVRSVWTILSRSDAAAAVIAERLFTQTVSPILTAIRRPHDRASAQVLLACAAEEHHTLPLDVLAAALAEDGISSCVLGARVPSQALATAAGRLRPAVVAAWSQTRDTADPRQITALLTAGPAMIAAGPGWTSAALPTSANLSSNVAAALTQTRTLLRTSPPTQR
ncbi:hypothetical protein [Paractinoplanes rishiriensis]|uniref:hypothetical protein n=1 Tax=Paractinoplanes rishiriensis TaxID=1050105 RepID=UPI001944AA88|nr:hypothetical protein [Actinoplanes rishiriensis]